MANKLTLETLDKTLNTVGVLLDRVFQNEKKWFMCFGTLLGMIRDRKPIENDYDIDIGILQENIPEKQMFACFERFAYRAKKIVRANIFDKTLQINSKKSDLVYACFVHDKLPTIDVFGWHLHNGIRYHTYDYMNEGKERPSLYVWKGVEEHLLNRIERSRFGTTAQPIFSRHIPFPFMYGHLLDTWYPDWKTARGGESTTPYRLEMKSCKGFHDKADVKAQLEKSKQAYNAYLATIK